MFHNERVDDEREAMQQALWAGVKGVVTSSNKLPENFRESRKRRIEDDRQSQGSADGGGVAHYGRRAALHRLARTSGKVPSLKAPPIRSD